MDLGLKVFAFGIGVMTLITVLLLMGRGSFFLVGRTFSSIEERDRFDSKKFLQFIGMCVGGFDLALVVALISYITKIEALAIVSAIIILGISVGASAYMKTGERFQKDS